MAYQDPKQHLALPEETAGTSVEVEWKWVSLYIAYRHAGETTPMCLRRSLMSKAEAPWKGEW